MPSSTAADLSVEITPRERLRVLWASFIGTAIEWYDFFLYGSATALVFAPQFFPSTDPLSSTLAAFGAFTIGFVARPLGGVVMGSLGDRLGRKSMLMLSMMLMGGSTVAMGLLPNYQTIGVAAPIILVALRLIQGIGVGGEWGGAVLMAVEYSPRSRRALYGAIPGMGIPAGIILANLIVFWVSAAVAPEAFAAWAWRIPFLASGVLVIVGFYIRLKVGETPSFKRLEASAEVLKNPLGMLFRRYTVPMLLGGLISIVPPIVGHVLTVFMLTFMTQAMGMPQSQMLIVIIFGSVVQFAAMPLVAVFADKVGHKRSYMLGMALTAVWIFPMFALITSGSFGLMLLAYAVSFIIHPLMSSPQGAVLAGIFPPQVRYSGASISYQIASVIAGFSPLIAAALVGASSNVWPLATYMVVSTVVCLIGAVFMKVGTHAHE
ncbi:MFS transporter [Brevibacterium ammoniilyticum]|uniref:MFS transporter n=1 Tax=Brevibacterium ammoniilyticum TaxID=1046555 RepID=A0ABP9U818_9MICO